MTDLELSIKALQAGILPAFTGDEVAKLLETCDEEEARKLKRKFRKLWRREMKAQLKTAESDTDIRSTMTLFSSPTMRRRAVQKMLQDNKQS